ncbi:hypothetical protein [Aquincola tertiaricarbonis]|uniref:hypothetical protein n=1 Tax=Aquincola tertiaricarbonis TaxID=391953 RepID=UPI001E422D64|nr:hypothetical protein [Aquincola tertiaricarbonis]
MDAVVERERVVFFAAAFFAVAMLVLRVDGFVRRGMRRRARMATGVPHGHRRAATVRVMKRWLIGALVLWMAFQSVAAAARPVMPCCAAECHDALACATMACSPACMAAAAVPAAPADLAWTTAADAPAAGPAMWRMARPGDEIWKPPRGRPL